MDINIKRSPGQELALKKIVWKRFAWKYYLMVLIIVTIALCFLSANLKIDDVDSPFWNLMTAFGLGLLMIGILRLSDAVRQRRRYMKNPSNESIIKITSEEITYLRTDVEAKFKWTFFKFYQISGELIILKHDLLMEKTLIISQTEISSSEFQFIKEMMFQHKILQR